MPVVSQRSVAATSTAGMDAPRALTLDFLRWIDRQPRTYAEALEAWRTSCPRLPVWEDAFGDGLVCLLREGSVRMSETPVILTPRGRALLDGD